MSPNIDIEIVNLLQAKNEGGLRLLYKNYSHALYGIITRIVVSREESDEVLNDVFLKAFTNIHQFDESKSKFFTWLARIARNTAIDKVRSADSKRSRMTINIENNASDLNEKNYAEQTITDSGLLNIVQKMEPDLKQIVELIYLKSFTFQECADELQMPLGTVKTKVRRTMMILREALKSDLGYLLGISILFILAKVTFSNLG